MIDIKEKSKCCGCTACKNICPVNAIKMIEDDEGFLYPKVDQKICINCGLCEKVCPITNKLNLKNEMQKAYVVNNKDDQVRMESTSGGAFTAIAEYVISKNGVVFGATFDDEFYVHHTYVENKEELGKFRGSKYVQSDVKECFKETKNFLDSGRLVCFSGTPCQIQGLKKYLQYEYENLITVDVVCRAVPSPLVLKKYIEYQKIKLNVDKFNAIAFRNKEKYGYKYSTMTLKSDNNSYYQGVETDPYLRAFFKNYSDRPACFDCKFRNPNRVSDFTIWDCFTIGEICKELDDNKGTTRVIVHNKKAIEIFNEIKNKFNYEEISMDVATNNVKELKTAPIPNEKRNEFFNDIRILPPDKFFEKYFPDSIKVKVERRIRKIFVNTTLYNKLKKVAKKLINK